MPIRYFIDLNCTPRESIGSDELVALLARWERAELVRGQFVEKYGEMEEEKMRFREKVVSDDGSPEKRERSVAGLRAECGKLWEYDQHCRGCPASVTETPYGCTAAVSFPISAAAEQWLVDTLAPAGSKALELFFDNASRLNFGSAPALEKWRSAGIFERDEPAKADRGGLLVSSDQVLHELFFLGDLQPPHILGVLLHLSALRTTDDREGDALVDMIQGVSEAGSAEEAPMIDFALMPEEGEDNGIRELKHFLFAAFRAFSLEVPLAIRM